GGGDGSAAAREGQGERHRHPPTHGRGIGRDEGRGDHTGRPRTRGGRDGAPVRHPPRRLRDRSQVPAPRGHSLPPRAVVRRGGGGGGGGGGRLDAPGGGADPDRHGQGRAQRPRGWRVPPVLLGGALE